MTRIRNRCASAIAALALLALASGAGANELVSPGHQIRIGSEGLSPSSLELANGETFVFVNEASSSTRIVFDRKSAKHVTCQLDDASQSRTGQYLLNGTAAMRCGSTSGRLSYTVFQQKGSTGVTKTKGKVSFR